MSNPHQPPEPSSQSVEHARAGSSKWSHKRLRRLAWRFVGLGVLAPLLGMLFTVYGMVQAFHAMAQTPGAPQPSDLANEISASISTAVVASACGWIVAAVLLPVGIVLLVKAGRRRREES
ncbi:MAG: MotA/TolQ/ExbB proton channel family protein [Pirellulales bacterium]|nr:MotA/TolQ/ExbB proton channel family protein [Pirellulales bacterium]